MLNKNAVLAQLARAAAFQAAGRRFKADMPLKVVAMQLKKIQHCRKSAVRLC